MIPKRKTLTLLLVIGNLGLIQVGGVTQADPPIVGSEPYRWRQVPIGGGGNINCLAINPHRPSVIFAGCDVGGAYKSEDYGATWRIVHQGLRSDADQAVAGFAFDPVDPEVVYLATGKCFGKPEGPYGGLFKSTDGGESWQILSREARFCGHGDRQQMGTVLAVDPRDPRTLWAATCLDGLLRSQDGGGTWQAMGLEGEFFHTLLLGSDGQTVYAASQAVEDRPGGVFRSVDGGVTWERLLEGDVRSLALDPHDPSRLYAAHFRQGILRSADGGETWTPANAGLEPYLEHLRLVAVAVAPSAPNILYAAGREPFGETDRWWRFRHPGEFRSDDGGETWRPLPESVEANVDTTGWWQSKGWFSFHPNVLAVDPQDPQRVYFSDYYGVWRSADGGANWQWAHRGLEVTCVLAVAPHPRVRDVVYFGLADVGFFKTTDGGRSTTAYSGNASSLGSLWSLAVDPRRDMTTLYGAEGGPNLLRSEDAGETWTRVNPEALPDKPITSVTTSPDGSTLFVTLGEGGGLWQSPDGGMTWESLGRPEREGQAVDVSLVLSPADPSTLYGLNSRQGLFRRRTTPPLDPLLRKGGWERLPGEGLDWPREHWNELTSLAVDPRSPETLYLSARSTGVYRSRDGGKAWEMVLPEVDCSHVAVDPHDSTLYAVGMAWWWDNRQRALYASHDGGQTWRTIHEGFPGNLWVNRLVVDPHVPGRLWVGTEGNGVFVGERG